MTHETLPIWKKRAACRYASNDLFFVDRGQSTTEAKQLCKGCPVRIECLHYAVTRPETFGTWGGTTNSRRVKIRKHLGLSRNQTSIPPPEEGVAA